MILTPVQERIRAFAIGSVLVTGGIAGIIMPWSALVDGRLNGAVLLFWWLAVAFGTVIVAGIANGLWRLQPWARWAALWYAVFAAVVFTALFAWSVRGGESIVVQARSTYALLGIVASILTAHFFLRGTDVASAFILPGQRVAAAPLIRKKRK